MYLCVKENHWPSCVQVSSSSFQQVLSGLHVKNQISFKTFAELFGLAYVRDTQRQVWHLGRSLYCYSVLNNYAYCL